MTDTQQKTEIKTDLEQAEPKSFTLLRIKAVSKRTGMSRSSIYEKVKQGKFPKPIKLGPKTSAWIQQEIDKHIYDLAAQRGA